MKSHGILMVGRFFMQRLPTKPAWTTDDVGRLIFVEDENLPYYGGTVDTGRWIGLGHYFVDTGTGIDPVTANPFLNREYTLNVVNGNIRLVYDE